MKSRTFLCLASLVAGCVPAPARYVNPHPAERIPISVQVAPDPFLAPADAAAACAVWQDTGVVCVPAAAAHDAPVVTVITDYRRCPTTNGGSVYGVTEGRQITLLMDCLLIGGVVERPLLRRILAHELGHALGIPHIPRECEPWMRYCGPALMNDAPELEYVTPADFRALIYVRQRRPR